MRRRGSGAGPLVAERRADPGVVAGFGGVRRRGATPPKPRAACGVFAARAFAFASASALAATMAASAAASASARANSADWRRASASCFASAT